MASRIPVQPTEAEQRWISRRGLAQLDQLNSMERGQDLTTWSTSAIYSATNGVLILAAINTLDHSAWSVIIFLLSVLGSLISTAWFLIVVRAHRYEVEYLLRARWLQYWAQVPVLSSVWQDPDRVPRPGPEGIRSFHVLQVLTSGFYWLWITLMFTSTLLSAGDFSWSDQTWGWRIVLTILVGVVALYVYWRLFWRQIKGFESYRNGVIRELGL